MTRAGESRPSALIDAESAGALLGVPSSWVLAQARRDRIPHVRLGRYVRFDSGELEAWWRGRMRGPVPRPGPHPVSRRARTP
jgi:excisionase family DNA binding protein